MGFYWDDKVLLKEEKTKSYLSRVSPENTFSFDELKKKDIKGIPFAICELNQKVYYSLAPLSNALIIGSTRSGKTTSFFIPFLTMIIKQKSMGNFLAVDIKGEIYSILAPIMEKEGVTPLIINTKDYKHSECFNFLAYIYDNYQDYLNIENEVDTIEEGEKYVFQDCIYATKKQLDKALKLAKETAIKKIENEIDNNVNMIIGDVSKEIDQYWLTTAKRLLRAFLMAMLEDSREDRGKKIQRDNYNLKTINDIVSRFTISDGSCIDNGYFSKRPKDCLSYQWANSAINVNALNTKQCVISTFESKQSGLNEAIAQIILSTSTFSFEKLLESKKKFGLFIMCRDDAKTAYNAIQLIISRLYCILSEQAEKQCDNKLEDPFYFVLDEFGNFPKLLDFDNKISVCSGKNVFFFIGLQSYGQLLSIYGDAEGKTILDNINATYFMGSNNYKTIAEFSESGGEKQVLSYKSINYNSNEEVLTVFDYQKERNVPIEELVGLKEGECFISIGKGTAFKTMLKRYYQWEEKIFTDERADAKKYRTLRERENDQLKEEIDYGKI